ncbi:hypothetical protein F4779DRAFT_567206 [Xylariaceae sp. FL0662B]|nr:hypothetical protein F4779DRAFT_567206 [Xylariaceae sp. FL0662B]
MPPRGRKAAAAASAPPKERQSKLAKEHNISAREEREIKEAFALFAEPMDGEKEGVIPINDVRRAMVYVSPRAAFSFSFSLCLPVRYSHLPGPSSSPKWLCEFTQTYPSCNAYLPAYPYPTSSLN